MRVKDPHPQGNPTKKEYEPGHVEDGSEREEESFHGMPPVGPANQAKDYGINAVQLPVFLAKVGVGSPPLGTEGLLTWTVT